MNRNLLIAIIILLIGGGVLVGAAVFRKSTPAPKPTPTQVPTATPSPTPLQMTVQLNEENKSGESGTATITENNGKLQVVLALTGEQDGVTQPAHIHVGKCPGVGTIKYPLTSVVSGTSSTTIDKVTTIADLLQQLPLAINVHKSTAAPGVYVACGEIMNPNATGSVTPSTSVSGMMHATPTVTGVMKTTVTPSGAMHASTTPTVAPTSTTGQ